MLWPVLSLFGFLFLIGFVIALGTRSTQLYEQAQEGQAGGDSSAAGSMGGG